MSVNLKLLDTFKLTGRLNKNFACDSSKDDRFFIITDGGLYILTQRPDLKSAFPQYMCAKYFLKPSEYALCEQVDIDINTFVYALPKEVLFESVASVELSQHLESAKSVAPSIVCAHWSDAEMVDQCWSMLGVLTNLYSLEIYVRSVNESDTSYKMLLNVTDELLKKRQRDFVYCAKMPPLHKMRELKKRVESVAPLTFAWTHTFSCNEKKCSIMFIGHFRGDISAFLVPSVQSGDSKIQGDFICRYSSGLNNISALNWHKTSTFNGALCLGDSDGRLCVLKVNLGNFDRLIETKVDFFMEKDRKVDKIVVTDFDSYTFLIAIKQSYLLIYGLDSEGRVFDFIAHNVNNYYITGVRQNGNAVTVLTLTGVMKQLLISVHFKKLVIAEKDVAIKYEFSSHITHGFVQSTNRVLYGLVLGSARLKNSIQGKKFVTVSIFHDSNLNPLKLLLDIKSDSLGAHWDCLEALRLICLKEQRFPWLGLSKDTDLDSKNLVQLKTLRLLASISETVFAVIKKVDSYEIRPYILLHHLVSAKLILERLRKLFKNRKELTVFQMQSVAVQVFFLKEVVVKGLIPKTQLGQNFVKEISHILSIANELSYPDQPSCKFCEEKVIGPICFPPHADSRCVFTMMQIFLAPSYKCSLCNLLAHDEMGPNPLVCPFCDYPMDKINLSENIKSELSDIEKGFDDARTSASCLADCLQDSKEILDELYLNLENNDVELINVSEDEEANEADNVKKLYLSLDKMSVKDSLCSE